MKREGKRRRGEGERGRGGEEQLFVYSVLAVKSVSFFLRWKRAASV
jgi:hypothetical protein